VYGALAPEPQTPNEIANKINLNQKTVQGALVELINSKRNISTIHTICMHGKIKVQFLTI
jgi:hypothetical protein